jgi:Flp pilus assembly protein TadB
MGIPLIKIFMWINISLFIVHEMDAVHAMEWKMMKFMDRTGDRTGYVIFTASHFFLFMLIFYLTDYHLNMIFPVISVLLILHQILHILFRKHRENRMNNRFSESVIYLMTANAGAGLLYFWFNYL